MHCYTDYLLPFKEKITTSTPAYHADPPRRRTQKDIENTKSLDEQLVFIRVYCSNYRILISWLQIRCSTNCENRQTNDGRWQRVHYLKYSPVMGGYSLEKYNIPSLILRNAMAAPLKTRLGRGGEGCLRLSSYRNVRTITLDFNFRRLDQYFQRHRGGARCGGARCGGVEALASIKSGRSSRQFDRERPASCKWGRGSYVAPSRQLIPKKTLS